MFAKSFRWLPALLLIALPLAGQGEVATLVAGPMVGHATETTVKIWVQGARAGAYSLRCRPADAPADAPFLTGLPVSPRAEDAFCAHLELTGLEFGTVYAYEVLLDGAVVPLAGPLRFRTQPHWHYRTEPPDFVAAIGSCSYVNDPRVDRPGKPYGGDPRIFDAIAAAGPQLMLWLGDNVYYREPDWTSASAMRARYTYDRRNPNLRPLLSSLSHYAIWDDHDYGPNDSDRSAALKMEALQTFKLVWENPSYGIDGGPGVSTRFTWGDAEFFLLDDRFFRTPNKVEDPGRVMFGAAQVEWLLDALASSTATFKIVAGGNQILNPIVNYEGFGRYPEEKKRLLDGLLARKIEGLVFLSGDRHHAELIRVARPGTYDLFDFTSSPLLSGMSDARGETENPARVPGTLVTESRNFGLLGFSGTTGNRILRLSCHGEDGKELWAHELPAASLR